MRKILAAILGVVLLASLTTPALANCHVGMVAQPVVNVLPVSDRSTEYDKAAFAWSYFEFALAIDSGNAPAGYYRGQDPSTPGGSEPGFYAGVFISCTTNYLVVSFDNTEGLADLIGGAIRQANGGESPSALTYVQGVIQQYPDYNIALVGHSAGGNMAAYVGGVLGLPSITFNATRTDAGLANNGARQMNVIVQGDRVGDPAGSDRALAGVTLFLPHVGRARPHTLASLQAGLAHILFSDATVASAR